MKVPQLKRPTGTVGAPQAPQFLKDLYADLSDRHLLLPVIALIVAIAAVPFLLGGGGSEVPVPPPTSAVNSDDALQIEPAVLTEAAGIRSYRKRLAALRKKNPFDQHFTGSKPGQESEVAVEDGSAEVAIAGETGGSEPVSSAGATSPASISASDDSASPAPSDTSSDPSVSTGGEAAAGSGSTQGVPESGTSFYTGAVDVSFGALGDAKRYKNVKRFTSLPNDRDPVVAFLGLSADTNRAYFLVSPAVTRLEGDGACTGQGSGCQFLEISVGEEETLTVGATEPKASPAGVSVSTADRSGETLAAGETRKAERQAESITYRLKLLDTRLVEITDPGDE